MATLVNLPLEIIKAALEQAAKLRSRNATSATNTIIKQALEQEEAAIHAAIPTLQTVPDAPPTANRTR